MSGYWMFGSYMGTITSICDAYWLVIGDLPYLAWVNGGQPYFEQTTKFLNQNSLFGLDLEKMFFAPRPKIVLQQNRP